MKDNGHSDFINLSISWRDGKVTTYVNGKKVNIRKPVRFKKLKRFVKLLMSRNLRQRLERYQIAHGRGVWEGQIVEESIHFYPSVLSSEEIAEIYRRSGLGDESEEARQD